MQDTRVPSPDGKDPLEEKMAAHSVFLLGNPIDRGARWATVYGVARVRHDFMTKQQQM